VNFVRVTCMDRFDKAWLLRQASSALLPGILLALLASSGLGQLPPDEAWRTLETTHLRVTYPDGMEDLAQRAGERGEAAWELLSERFVEPPEGVVDVIISDHADISNGFAQVFPSNRIVIYAPPPVDGFGLAYMNEWMELVIVHELTHIFHQDMARGVGGAFRQFFGRVPLRWPFFPGLATPNWTVEGIAVYYESALTGAGRVKGSFHEMVVRTAVLEGDMDSIDRVSGASQIWPGGQRDYAYGSLFLNYLVDQHGEEAVSSFVREVAGQWIPYRLDSAARRAFGTSFSRSWEEWEAELQARYRTLRDSLAAWAPLTRGETLTEEGYYALNPAPSPSGDRVLFSRQDGHSDNQLRLLDPNTGKSGKLARTNSLANFSWTPEGGVVFSQIEYVDAYRLRGDLYRIRPDGGEERLSRGERLDHPDVDPTGRWVVAVQEGRGTNRLVLLDLESREIIPLNDYESPVHWSYPRWSPGGQWIAVARWRPGAHMDLVLLDREGAVVQEITRDRAIDNAPVWSPDGRWLLWASDRSGIPNLYAVEIRPDSGEPSPRLQVTNVLGGAAFPGVDPQGEWIYYSGYHADGWHLERIPFDPGRWFAPLPESPNFVGTVDTTRYDRKIQAPQERYDPLPTLAPTYWSPAFRAGDDAGSVQVLKPRFGIATSGVDLAGRHSYSLVGLYSGGPGGFEGAAAYSFAGLGNPVLTLSATQFLDAEGPLAAPDESGDLLYTVERERGVGIGATLFRRRSRSFSSVSISGRHIWEERTLLEEDLRESERFRLTRPDARLGEARVAVALSTARTFPLSISPEDGIGVVVRGRTRRELALVDTLRGLPGQDRSLRDLVGQLTAYKGVRLPGFGNHVLAFRGSGGVAGGAGADQFHFEVGGASGEGLPLGLVDLAQGLAFPVRGYDTASRFGRYAWSVSAEYRFPLFLVNRGPGLFPLHLDWLSGTLFLDAGNAWGPELGFRGYENPRKDPLTSVGGEITARVLPFWYGIMDLRVGVAAPLLQGNGVRAYLRLGPSF